MRDRCRNNARKSQTSGVALALSVALSACAAAPPNNQPPQQVAVTPSALPVVPAHAEPWLIEDFEQPNGTSGGFWFEFDKNPLGTKAEPNPFKLSPGGTLGSSSAAHISGVLGANREPWTWVQLQLFLDRSKQPQNLTEFKSLRFWAKGDGGRYGVALVKRAVKNYDHFHYEFTAPREWTEFRVPLTEFTQAGWGEKLPRVFDDVTTVQFYPALHEKPFDVWFDNVTLSHEEVSDKPIAYDTRGWFAWTGIDPAKRRGTALDVSRLLDAPAGKHGPVQRKGDQFAFRDGVSPHFFGVNIVASANFPSHAEAEKLAELLAQLGVNMTRHHHLDAAWSTPNLFGNRSGTSELDPEALERFDYFINQLQKRGIYQYFDMLVHRKLTDADGVPDANALGAGLKIEGEFASELIPLEQRFIEAFLGHKNQYSGRVYAKDPAVALIDIINEDSLLWLQPSGDFALKTPHYRQELDDLFAAWLKKNGGSAQAADLSAARSEDRQRFLYETQLAYYTRMRDFLRKLGVVGLITGSNHWVTHPLDLLANAQMDFVDRHAYWAHPEGGWNYSREITWDPSSMVKDADLGILGALARRRVAGLPYAMSEWQTAAPNDYRVEGPLLMAAFASFTDAHPLEFAFSHDRDKQPDVARALSNNFDLIEQPSMLGAWPAAALLFHRHDLQRAKVDAFLKLDPKQLFTKDVNVPLPNGLALLARTGVDFHGGLSAAELEQLLAKQRTAAGGELHHDPTTGQVLIDTPRTQALIGFRSSNPVKLANAEIELESAFAVVSVSSLDDAPIPSSKHLLVSALGNAVNSEMSLTAAGNRLADPGHTPVLVEPIRGKLRLTGLGGDVARFKVYALGPSGERARELVCDHEKGVLILPLSEASGTLHYEVALR